MYIFCKESAFTLLELIITIAIVAIIISIALPSFHHFRAQQEVSQLLTTIRQNVNLSKSLATSYHNNIVMCSSSNLTNCENDQWNKGFIIFNDTNNNKQRENNELLHKVIKTDFRYGNLRWNGGSVNSKSIIFQGDTGLPRGSQGNFTYCSFNHKENHRYIPLSPMGHTRIETISSC